MIRPSELMKHQDGMVFRAAKWTEACFSGPRSSR